MLDFYRFSGKEIIHFLTIFCRLFPIIWLFPGFGMITISPNIRLAFTLMLTIMVFPMIASPIYPEHWPLLIGYVLKEILIGLFIGGCFALTMQILDTAGSIIGQQMGLNNTMVFNPILEGEVPLPSALLAYSSLALIFIMDLHHIILKAFFLSYQYLPVDPHHWTTMVEYTIKLFTVGFKTALQMASPFIIAIVFLQGALGILNRLVPSVHVFFLSPPLQISLCMIVLLGTLKGCLEYFTHFFHQLLFLFPEQ
jgi:flagellar biosynthetic protein FliR